MSAGGKDSIPAFAHPRAGHSTKHRPVTANTSQSASVHALFAKPDAHIAIPASSTPQQRALPPPPEIVTNVQGSSSGAGSGEFHVYKAARRREYERLRRMDDEVRSEQADSEFALERARRESADAEKTRRNREKRDKMKARKAKAKQSVAKDKSTSAKLLGGVAASTSGIPKRVDAKSDDKSDAKDNHTPQENSNVLPPVGTAPAVTVGLIIHDDD